MNWFVNWFDSHYYHILYKNRDEKEAQIFIDNLSDDDLPGIPGDDEHSYLGLMVNNLTIMVDALGGDSSYLGSLDVSPVFAERSEAEYPQ